MNAVANSANQSRVIRVSIVEDDRATREGLALLIDDAPGFRCVGAFPSVEDALAMLRAPLPDVLLLDIQLPGMSGTDGVAVIRARFPSIEVLMLTVHTEQEQIFASICRGATGYLLKKTPPSRLLDAIRETVDGGSPMSPEVARKVITLFRRAPAAETSRELLTPQEQRLIQILAEGYSYQAAAERLNISINTVRNYIRSVYDKLHVHSKSAAVTKALRSGLIH
jgi:DNA-binding NarL/FixJ family response regulator